MHDVDPDLKYCTKCGDEYRADILLCASCQIELISGEEILSQASGKSSEKLATPLGPEEVLVALQKGQLREMKNMQAIFKEKGIASLIMGESGDCGKGCCGPEVVLHVRQEEAEQAMKVLAHEFQRSTSLASHDLSGLEAVYDETAQEVTCPACGHQFIPSTPECPDCGIILA